LGPRNHGGARGAAWGDEGMDARRSEAPEGEIRLPEGARFETEVGDLAVRSSGLRFRGPKGTSPFGIRDPGLNLGSPDPLDHDRIAALARAVRESGAAWVSTPIGYVALGDRWIHVPLPLPVEDRIREAFRARTSVASEILSRPLLLEYLPLLEAEPVPPERERAWLERLLGETDCRLLLDLGTLAWMDAHEICDLSTLPLRIPFGLVKAVRVPEGKKEGGEFPFFQEAPAFADPEAETPKAGEEENEPRGDPRGVRFDHVLNPGSGRNPDPRLERRLRPYRELLLEACRKALKRGFGRGWTSVLRAGSTEVRELLARFLGDMPPRGPDPLETADRFLIFLMLRRPERAAALEELERRLRAQRNRSMARLPKRGLTGPPISNCCR